MAHRLDPLLRPRSIAVLGATEREATVGRHTIENLLKGGYEGGLYAVNPGAARSSAFPATRRSRRCRSRSST
jgi:acyl-CoA synthetase (NDP forming)